MDDTRPPPDPANDRYLRNLARRDWLAHTQTAYLAQRVSLRNARIKSHYVRYFGVTTNNVHFIEQEIRLALGPEVVEEAEASLLERLAGAMKDLDEETVRVSALLQSEGVTALPEYVQAPLEVEAKCSSPKITRYLECIVKADRLLTLLEALRLSGLVRTSEYERQARQAVRRLVTFARTARRTAFGLRKRVTLKSATARGTAEAAGAPEQASSEAVAAGPVANARPGVATQPEAAEMS